MKALPHYSIYASYNGSPPLPPRQFRLLLEQISSADENLRLGVDTDWRNACFLYPEILDHFFGLVELEFPWEKKGALEKPELLNAAGAAAGHGWSFDEEYGLPTLASELELKKTGTRVTQHKRSGSKKVVENPLLPHVDERKLLHNRPTEPDSSATVAFESPVRSPQYSRASTSVLQNMEDIMTTPRHRYEASESRRMQQNGKSYSRLPQAWEVAPDALPPVQNKPSPIEGGTFTKIDEHGTDAKSSATQFAEDLRRPTDEDRKIDDSIGTVAKAPSSTADDIIVDNERLEKSCLVPDGLSENSEEDVPLSSQTSAAIFDEAQRGLERLLLDLQFFDDDTEEDLSDASGDHSDICHSTVESSSDTFEPEDACDEDQDQPSGPPEGRQSGSQHASGSISQGAGVCHQVNNAPNNKRQRIDSDDDDRSSAIVKSKRRSPVSNREQMLICCYRGDPLTPCLGTDKSIGEVIDRLASCHNIYICKTCYMLLVESDSGGGNVHPNGVDCVEHCLSPRCLGDATTTDNQLHRFNPKSCGTKTTRSRPEDRETIFRYIFRLVHPSKEIPPSVFTAGKTPHLGMLARQGNRRPTRDELESRVRRLNEQFEELRKRDTASTRQIDVLTRNLETERANNNYLEEKVQRLQDIIADAIRPGTLSDEHWYRSILQRVKRDAPGALEHQAFQTQPASSHHGSRSSNTVPTPTNDTATTTGQYQPSRHVSLQAPGESTGQALGKNPATDLTMPQSNLSGFAFPNRITTHDGISHSTPVAPSGTTTSALSEHHLGLDRQWHQDTPSGASAFRSDLMDTTEMQDDGANAILPSSETLQNQDARTFEMWDEFYFRGYI